MVMLVLTVLLCNIGCLKLYAANWVIVNSMAEGKGAYAVVTTYDYDQEMIWILKPGDAGVYRSQPIDISVFHIPDNTRIYRADMKKVSAGLTVLRYQDGVGVFINSGNINASSMYLVNAAPYPATYHVDWNPHRPACPAIRGPLNYGTIKEINNPCTVKTLQAWYIIGNQIFTTDEVPNSAREGVYVFRKSADPANPEGFQLTGPWPIRS